jgi:hypothetical protein
VQFISYEGSFTAVGGPAAGLTSTDIGVSESSSTPVGFSLQLTGTGSEAADFTWTSPTDDTPGAVNNGQTFVGGSANVLISEFQPNPTGTDPATTTFELSGTAGTTFNGVIVSIESDSGSQGTVDRVASVSGTFDVNGLLTVDIPDLENPSFTVALLSEFTGTVGTDIDTNDDGVADDLSTFGTVLDAIGVPDSTADEVFLYGAELGGVDFAFTGDEPRLIFRDGSVGDLYAINDPDNGQVFDVNGNDVTPGIFDTDPTLGTDTFGIINPTVIGSGNPAANIIINEIDADQTSTDEAEFIELYDGGIGNTSLDGLVLVLYNGNGDVSYNAIDLDGFTTDAEGFFVIGSSNVPNVDLVAFTSNGLQNGADAVALYMGDGTDFPNGTAVTTTNLIDAIAYDTNDADDAGLLSGLGLTTQFNEDENNNGTTESLSRVPDGSGSLVAQAPTPGAINGFAPPPPSGMTAIYDIQGATHTSPFNGNTVTTTGIVTAVDSNGFYLQDATGDGNIATSDAIFIFTGSAPSIAVGDGLEVTGTVSEFFPGGASSGNLSTTQISSSTITTLSTGNPLPTSTLIGAGGRIPPTENIDDDAFAIFDPVNDGIDFFESLEGMLVTAQDLVAVSGTNRFGEIFAVVDNGVGATGISQRGTLNIGPDDFNPEKIQIDEDTGIFDFAFPNVNTGDSLGNVTGVVSYSFGNFEILPTQDFTSNIQSAGLQADSTIITGAVDKLTVATYNVLNLDPNDSDGDTDIADGRFTTIAQQIVNNLNTPDIIGLQEIQDNSGSLDDGTISASQTLQMLVDAIAAAGGPPI